MESKKGKGNARVGVGRRRRVRGGSDQRMEKGRRSTKELSKREQAGGARAKGGRKGRKRGKKKDEGEDRRELSVGGGPKGQSERRGAGKNTPSEGNYGTPAREKKNPAQRGGEKPGDPTRSWGRREPVPKDTGKRTVAGRKVALERNYYTENTSGVGSEKGWGKDQKIREGTKGTKKTRAWDRPLRGGGPRGRGKASKVKIS